MKIIVCIFCLISLFGCAKYETIPLAPTANVAVSHLYNDDLVLVDNLIKLKIRREEAIKRGVPASEYDFLEETLIRHNNKRGALTKSMNRQILAWGMLQDPVVSPDKSNSVYGVRVDPISSDSIILFYTMGNSDGYSILDYDFYGAFSTRDSVSGVGQLQGSVPVPGFWWGFMSLAYTYWGLGYSMCVYSVETY